MRWTPSCRALPDVDPSRVAVAGVSFGGSLTLLLTERERTLRAAVVFAAAGCSWERSPQLRARLGKPHRVEIYPAVGRTADDGHDFIDLGVMTWEPDVFAFLDEHTRRYARPTREPRPYIPVILAETWIPSAFKPTATASCGMPCRDSRLASPSSRR